MARFRAQAERFGAHVIDEEVERVDFSIRRSAPGPPGSNIAATP